MSESYPKYDPYDIGESDCWEKYAKKIKKLKKEKTNFKYPLDKNSFEFLRTSLHKSMIVDMKPEKFLELAIPKTHIRACSLNYLFDAFKRGKPKLDPLYLKVDPTRKEIDYDDFPKKKCPVIGHEGRHRAEIAMDLEIKKIPVLIDYAPNYTLRGYNEIKKFDKEREKDGWNGNYHDLGIKLMKDKWEPPNNCSVDNLKSESSPDIFFEKERPSETREKWKELRKQHGLV